MGLGREEVEKGDDLFDAVVAAEAREVTWCCFRLDGDAECHLDLRL